MKSGNRPLWQFQLWTLMLFTAGVAVSFAYGELQPLLLIIGGILTMTVSVCDRLTGPVKPRSWNVFLCVLIGAVLAEFHAAHLAYYTIGEIVAFGALLQVVLNIVPIVLFRWARPLAYLLVLALAAWMVPEQIALGISWCRRDDEARSVVAYLNAYHAQHGAYPADLSGYTFHRPDLAGEIFYSTSWNGPGNPGPAFYLGYHIGTENTTHSYTPEGGWFYYPD